jgi:hypothetical protein
MRRLISPSTPSVNSFVRKMGSGFSFRVLYCASNSARFSGSESVLKASLTRRNFLVIRMIASRQGAVHALDGLDLGSWTDAQQLVIVYEGFFVWHELSYSFRLKLFP